jgi:hypothetical protein
MVWVFFWSGVENGGPGDWALDGKDGNVGNDGIV